jgi:hypothetical protein
MFLEVAGNVLHVAEVSSSIRVPVHWGQVLPTGFGLGFKTPLIA